MADEHAADDDHPGTDTDCQRSEGLWHETGSSGDHLAREGLEAVQIQRTHSSVATSSMASDRITSVTDVAKSELRSCTKTDTPCSRGSAALRLSHSLASPGSALQGPAARRLNRAPKPISHGAPSLSTNPFLSKCSVEIQTGRVDEQASSHALSPPAASGLEEKRPVSGGPGRQDCRQ